MMHIEKTDSEIERAAQVLRRRIVSGELAGGARLGQQEIAAEFQLSRHHVQEVFRLLARDRLIVARANASATVAPLGALDYQELHELHLALEPMLGGLATPNLTGVHLARLGELLELMETAEDAVAFLDAHDLFHALIYRAAARPWMVELVDQVRQHARRYLNVLHSDSEWTGREIPHREILHALQEKDSLRVQQRLTDHMSEGHDQVFRQLLKAGIDSTPDPRLDSIP